MPNGIATGRDPAPLADDRSPDFPRIVARGRVPCPTPADPRALSFKD